MTAKADDAHIGLIVEGRGELEAVPMLLRQHLHAQHEFNDILGKPIPCNGRGNATAPNGLERYVATAAGRPGCRGILVVLDSEDDAACRLGPALAARAASVTDKPVVIALAEPKYEAWLVASAESLELPGLVFDIRSDPVALLKECLPSKYVKPIWQPRLSARLDLVRARPRAASLNRALERFDELRAAI